MFHIDYEVPSWWPLLHDSDNARYYATQWKAVLSLRQQAATVLHPKSISVDLDIDKQKRYGMCRELLDLVNARTVALNRERELATA